MNKKQNLNSSVTQQGKTVTQIIHFKDGIKKKNKVFNFRLGGIGKKSQ
jgi:hypothetical protein